MGQPNSLLSFAGEGVNVPQRGHEGIVRFFDDFGLGRPTVVYQFRLSSRLSRTRTANASQGGSPLAQSPYSIPSFGTNFQTTWRSLHGPEDFSTSLRRAPVLFKTGARVGTPVQNGQGVSHEIV